MTTSASTEVRLLRPQSGWGIADLNALWQYRELLYFLAWRDLKVRYKQTALGAAWAVIQPICTVILFSVVFGRFANLPSDGVPYPLLAFSALLPWTLFSTVVSRSGSSLVSSSHLISKVYFPRLVIPIASALASLVDTAISLIVLFAMMAFYGHFPGVQALTLPFWGLMVMLCGLAVGLALSALNVRFRDVTFLIGFLLQVWMYASPIAYSASIVPVGARWFYQLNPMVGFIQGTRWALLGTAGEMGIPWIPACIVTVLGLVGALIYFNRAERSFADVI